MDTDAQLAGQRVGLLGADRSQMVRDQFQALTGAESITVAELPEIRREGLAGRSTRRQGLRGHQAGAQPSGRSGRPRVRSSCGSMLIP
jgi:hypothetical protein